MAFSAQPVTLNTPNAGSLASPSMSGLIVSLSIAVLMLGLAIAAVFSLIAWAAG